MSEWVKLCSVGEDFRPTEGQSASVADAVRRGADLRRYSIYDPSLTGLVEETMGLQTTWVFDSAHVGGLSTLRHPAECGLHLFKRPSMAYWIFNVTAPSSSAFVPLDGQPMDSATGPWVRVDERPFDSKADAPWLSKRYHWWARDDWQEIYSHDAEGKPLLGDWKDVCRSAASGCALKVGIRNLWDHLSCRRGPTLEHEVFIECGTHFAHLDAGFFAAITIPTFLVRPSAPLRFIGEAFEPGWLLVRTDGRVDRQTLNPSSLKWLCTQTHHAIRWFAR